MVKETGDFKWAVPEELGVPPDRLRARLDFYHQAVVLNLYDEEISSTKVVSALDVAHALANDLAFGTGLLPPGTLFWRNTRAGPVYGLYVEPKVHKVALEMDVNTPPRRYKLPLPGLIFLCSPGKPPWVYAVARKPAKDSDAVFNAPLCNIHENGRSCPGTHQYPTRVADMVPSFFVSFFTASAHLKNRSKLYPNNIVKLWEYLDGKDEFPVNDLVRIGTLKDLMDMELT